MWKFIKYGTWPYMALPIVCLLAVGRRGDRLCFVAVLLLVYITVTAKSCAPSRLPVSTPAGLPVDGEADHSRSFQTDSLRKLYPQG